MKFDPLPKEIKSPLRYPGGKSRAIKYILPKIPDFKEYREPFLGGGSVFFALKQRMIHNSASKIIKPISWKLNDLNEDLIAFWKMLQETPDKLLRNIQFIKDTHTTEKSGRELYQRLHDPDFPQTRDERATRFFVLNRITFSGLADSGGYSQAAFQRRFTQSSIDRLRGVFPLLKNTTFTNLDYKELLYQTGKEVFIFLDPPYYKATKKRLYGKGGDLHLGFDHEEFARNMEKCVHNWLITYDDSEYIRDLFSFANITTWELQYGMNNFKQTHAKKGKELFISNF